MIKCRGEESHPSRGRRAFLLVLVAVGAFSGALWMGERKRERKLEVRVVPVAYTKDRNALEARQVPLRDARLRECHGADGRGVVFIDRPTACA
jgi:hypothetical protein